MEATLNRRAACGAAGAVLLAAALAAQPVSAAAAAAHELGTADARGRKAGQADTTITARVYLDIGESPLHNDLSEVFHESSTWRFSIYCQRKN